MTFVDMHLIYMANKLLIESSRQKDRQPHTSQHTDRPWGVVEEQCVLRGRWLCSPLPQVILSLLPPAFPHLSLRVTAKLEKKQTLCVPHDSVDHT